MEAGLKSSPAFFVFINGSGESEPATGVFAGAWPYYVMTTPFLQQLYGLGGWEVEHALVRTQLTEIVPRKGESPYAAEHNQILALLARVRAKFFVISGLTLALFGRDRLSITREQEAVVCTAVKEQILASTIQIRIYDQSRIETGVTKVHVTEGLGTLVNYGDERFIMTHNHWPLLAPDVERVELRNASGGLLVLLSRYNFHTLVRYRDAGTLMLKAPPQLSGITAAELGDSSTLSAGDRLWLATHDAQQGHAVDIIRTDIGQAGNSESDMPGQLWLRCSETAVAPGDSGGGVWHDGRLVGNMWAVVESLQNTPWSRQGWFSSPAALRPVASNLATAQPLPTAPVITPGDQTPIQATDNTSNAVYCHRSWGVPMTWLSS